MDTISKDAAVIESLSAASVKFDSARVSVVWSVVIITPIIVYYYLSKI
jgi:hypothetical protein